MIRRTLTAAALAAALATIPAIPAGTAHASGEGLGPDACPRILVTDEYGRDITPCGRPRPMTAAAIIDLVRTAMASRPQ